MRNDEGYGTGAVFFSFLLGGIVGAGIALLLAPSSGRETRQKIRDMADDVREKAGEYADQMKSRVSTTIHKGKEFIDEKKSILSAAVEAGKEAYEKEKEKLGEHS